jgi:hypothetical protein
MKKCNKTFEDCKTLNNMENFGSLRLPPIVPALRGSDITLEPGPAMLSLEQEAEKGNLFYDEYEGADDVFDAERYKLEYKTDFGTFANGGMIPESDFPKNTRYNFEKMKEALLKDVAMKQEMAFMEGGPIPMNVSGDDMAERYESSGTVDKILIGENLVYTKAPEGIPQEEWKALSTNSQEIILKRMGYNKEERKEFKGEDRAIDL